MKLKTYPCKAKVFNPSIDGYKEELIEVLSFDGIVGMFNDVHGGGLRLLYIPTGHTITFFFNEYQMQQTCKTLSEFMVCFNIIKEFTFLMETVIAEMNDNTYVKKATYLATTIIREASKGHIPTELHTKLELFFLENHE